MTTAHQDSIHFGLATFSSAAYMRVNVAQYNRNAIMSWLNSNNPGGGPQIGCGQQTAYNYLTGSYAGASGGPKYVLLITDGQSSNGCGGYIYQTQQLYNAGIKTFVVGFGSGVDPNQLNALAVAGHTDLPGATKYYNASNATELSAALGGILGQIACCGDGYLDTQLGEQCDDGNNVDGDGCDGLCQVEVPSNNQPVAQCQNITVSADAQCLASYAFTATATDNCSAVTPVQLPAGSSWGLGTTPGCGGRSCYPVIYWAVLLFCPGWPERRTPHQPRRSAVCGIPDNFWTWQREIRWY